MTHKDIVGARAVRVKLSSVAVRVVRVKLSAVGATVVRVKLLAVGVTIVRVELSSVGAGAVRVELSSVGAGVARVKLSSVGVGIVRVKLFSVGARDVRVKLLGVGVAPVGVSRLVLFGDKDENPKLVTLEGSPVSVTKLADTELVTLRAKVRVAVSVDVIFDSSLLGIGDRVIVEVMFDGPTLGIGDRVTVEVIFDGTKVVAEVKGNPVPSRVVGTGEIGVSDTNDRLELAEVKDRTVEKDVSVKVKMDVSEMPVGINVRLSAVLNSVATPSVTVT